MICELNLQFTFYTIPQEYLHGDSSSDVEIDGLEPKKSPELPPSTPNRAGNGGAVGKRIKTPDTEERIAKVVVEDVMARYEDNDEYLIYLSIS